LEEETFVRSKRRQIDHLTPIDIRAEDTTRPEHHIGCYVVANDQIIKAVAVNVAGG